MISSRLFSISNDLWYLQFIEFIFRFPTSVLSYNIYQPTYVIQCWSTHWSSFTGALHPYLWTTFIRLKSDSKRLWPITCLNSMLKPVLKRHYFVLKYDCECAIWNHLPGEHRRKFFSLELEWSFMWSPKWVLMALKLLIRSWHLQYPN